MNIYEKLQDVRIKLNDKNLKKTGKNTHSKFDYFELKDFLPDTMLLFKEAGLFSKFDIINEVINDNGVYEEIAVLTIFDTDKEDTFLEFKTPVAEVKIGAKADGSGGAQPIQNLGGKHTYLKRYLYQNALELSVNDIVDPNQDKEEKHEIFNGLFIPLRIAKKEIGITMRKLLQLIGGRKADFQQIYSDSTLGGKLEDASIIQLMKSERLLRNANIETTQWFSLYNSNSKIKNPVVANENIEHTIETRTQIRFGLMALSMTTDESKKLDIIEDYQQFDIDLNDFIEVE
jgi:hypothetical protein